MDESPVIFDPLQSYANVYRETHRKNTADYFEELIKQSKIDVNANHGTVASVKKKQAEIDVEAKKHKEQSGLRGFLIFLIVAMVVGSIILIVLWTQGEVALTQQNLILIVAGAAVLAIVGVVAVVRVSKAIKQLVAILAKKKQERDALEKTAWEQMRPLNELHDWGVSNMLVQKTIPIVKLDSYFDAKRFDYLQRKYGLGPASNPSESILGVQSGEIIGNPFLLCRMRHFAMGTKSYQGSLTISWTETVVINNQRQTVYRTQTLNATVTKPFPTYSHQNYLFYGNEAAPDLSFSRDPVGAAGKTEKQIEKLADREAKKIVKQSQKSIAKGGSFTAMANTEFDGLFSAEDRDNEVQFRLLFTPLAQRQMLDLIKDNKIGFGDQFSFIKRKCLNTIVPHFIGGAALHVFPNYFAHYDLETSRRVFNDFNNTYFKNLYFSLAPILAIPLYQQHEPDPFFQPSSFSSRLSPWEHQAVANTFSEQSFAHPSSVTSNMLKTRLTRCAGGADEVVVTAYGYQGIQRTDYVSVYGGDGRYHNVPVLWTEYLPVSKDTPLVVKPTPPEMSLVDFFRKPGHKDWRTLFASAAGQGVSPMFARHMMAYIATKSLTTADDQTYDKLFAD